MKKIILLGSSGYIGSAFVREIEKRGFEFICPDRNQYQTFGLMWALLKNYPCDLVINSAAFITKPSVDLCEGFKQETISGNLVLPVNISNACEAAGVPLIHVSTGCLYNGDNEGNGFSEQDKPHLEFNSGAGFYVGSKAMAEDSIGWENSYICRIRLPFDEFDNERNLLSKLQAYPKICPETQSISHRGDFVKACLDLVETKAPFGIYNCTNPGSMNYMEICDRINRIIFGGRRDFKFWDMIEFDGAVARTKKSRCVLSNDKLKSAGITMRPVQEAVDDALNNWV